MMNRSFVALGAILLLTASLGLVGTDADARSKKWTITQRQEVLKKEIDRGQVAGELTLKEANSLRGQEAKIEIREAIMKAKNAGKLSYENENAVEKALNKLSLRIQKLKLEKRVQK
jgi:hypothetical protein